MIIKEFEQVKDKYQIIYADPAWSFNNKKTGGSMLSGASSKYNTMDYKQIASMPIRDICQKNAVLYMWWVSSMPEEAIRVVKGWGFTIKTMTAFTWVKTNKDGTPAMGMGYKTRQNAENCLVAQRGIVKTINHSIRQTHFFPRLRHSEKPKEIRELITDLHGDLKRVELFCRGSVPGGWDNWGNEAK